jgi:predicted molibdopterin-dependent oxidoreductase YjgC
VSGRFHEIIRKHGPHAVASCGSGQLDSEVGYFAVKLFKGSIGTNNTDSNSRLCMAAAVAGYRTSLAADGPPTCYADINLSECPSENYPLSRTASRTLVILSIVSILLCGVSRTFLEFN